MNHFNITLKQLILDKDNIEEFIKNKYKLNIDILYFYNMNKKLFEQMYNQEHSKIIYSKEDLVLFSENIKDAIEGYYLTRNKYIINDKIKKEFGKRYIYYFQNMKSGILLKRHKKIDDMGFYIKGNNILFFLKKENANTNNKNYILNLLNENKEYLNYFNKNNRIYIDDKEGVIIYNIKDWLSINAYALSLKESNIIMSNIKIIE